MRHTKIICTIGPVSNSSEKLLELARNGMNIARLNMSHGTYEWHTETIQRIKEINQKTDYNIGIVLDTKGPEIRSGDLSENIVLNKNDELTITTDETKLNQKNTTQVSYKGFVNDVAAGDQILVDSGIINLQVVSKDTQNIVCKVLDGGTLTSRRHLNILGKSASLPTITEKDWADINFGIQMGVDFFAISFVKNGSGVQELRDYLNTRDQHIKLISKLETTESVKNLEEIIEVSDAVMVARGDLGAELPIEDVPLIQDEMVRLAQEMNKPVIVATQLLESMMTNPTPTRAEVTDIANAVRSKADAIMLSGETAGGSYPIKAVSIMNRVASKIESQISDTLPIAYSTEDVEREVVLGGCVIAENIQAKAIVVLTRRGYTAQLISQCRPINPVYAYTESASTARKLSLFWGVKPVHMSFADKAEATIQKILKDLRDRSELEYGDLIVFISDLMVGQDMIDTVQIRRIGE